MKESEFKLNDIYNWIKEQIEAEKIISLFLFIF